MLGFKRFQDIRCERNGVEFGQLMIQPFHTLGVIVAVGEGTNFGTDALPVAHGGA